MKNLNRKNKKELNVTVLLGIILVSVFILWNTVWAINIMMNYLPYRNALPKDEYSGSYILSENNYSYSIKLPNYLTFTGNLAIVNSETHESLLIWPKMINRKVYGVRLSLSDEAASDVFSMYELYVDKNGIPIGDSTQDKKIWEEKQEIIQTLFDMCNRVWNIK